MKKFHYVAVHCNRFDKSSKIATVEANSLEEAFNEVVEKQLDRDDTDFADGGVSFRVDEVYCEIDEEFGIYIGEDAAKVYKRCIEQEII